MKKALLWIISVILFLLVVSPAAYGFVERPFKLEIDGEQVQLEKPILIVDGRSLLPMRTFFELCGASVSWDDKNRIAIAQKGDHKVAFPIDSQLIMADNQLFKIDVPAMIINDSTYIPIRAAGQSLGFNVKWDPKGVIQMGKAVASDGETFEPYIPETVLAGSYDAKWYQDDRNHFAVLFRIAKAFPEAKDVLYREYVVLMKQKEQIEAKAYRSKRGYTIYSPQITEQLNTLQIAAQARSLLLRDIELNKIRTMDDYYPKNYRYLVVGKENHIPDVVPTQKTNFNLNEVASIIDRLPIPDRLLHGLKIWYINGYLKDSSEVGYYVPGILGNFHSRILVFNVSTIPRVKNTLLGTTLHEVGHLVGNAIFRPNLYDPMMLDNQQAVKEYVSIYRKEIYNDKGSWGNRVSENFAEDFKNVFLGEEKHSGVWQGEHKTEVYNFIKKHITDVDLSEHYLEGYAFVTPEGSFSHFYNPYETFERTETFVTKSNNAYVHLKGIDIADKNFMIIAVPLGGNGEDVIWGERKEDKWYIKFPQKGVYEIQIWIGNSYIMEGFNFHVVVLGD